MKIVVCQVCADLIANWDKTVKECRCKATKCKYDKDGFTLLIESPVMPFVFAVNNFHLIDEHKKWNKNKNHKGYLESWTLPSNHEQLKRVDKLKINN